MKCREAQYWLYSFQPNAAWPVDVVGHLQQCTECQQLQAHLRQIDQEVNKLTTLPKNKAPIEQLIDRIEKTPQEKATSPSPPTPLPRGGEGGLWRYASYLAALAAMLLIGVFVGTWWSRGTSDSGKFERVVEYRDKPITAPPADQHLLAALFKRNALLVQAVLLEDRLKTLLDMADDCRQHALGLIQHGPRDGLPMTIDLYEELLQEGIVAQVAQAPKEQRNELRQTARNRLEKMAEASIEVPDAFASQRNAMLNAASQALKVVKSSSEIKSSPRPSIGEAARAKGLSPAAALVRFAITYSAEPDLVAKADLCSDYVKRLMPFMKVYLAEDASPQRTEMGQQFGEMIQFGVYVPLQAAADRKPDESVQAQMTRIFKDVDGAVAEMEKQWQATPDASKAAMEGMLKATKSKGKSSFRDPTINPEPKGKGKVKSGREDRRSSMVPGRSIDYLEHLQVGAIAGHRRVLTGQSSSISHDSTKSMFAGRLAFAIQPRARFG